MTWLGVYQAFTPKVELGDNSTVRLDLDNEPQPDAVLLIDGGQARVSKDDYIEGAPELVVEIAASSAAYDLYDKKQVYRRNGVREYLVWRVYDQKLDWFSLTAGEYIKLEPDHDGIMRSQVFPGLWLATSQLLSGNMNEVLAVLQQGLNSVEHQQFSQGLSD
jgi:Uma2 family endonuclease